jgi:transposase InsO family protein
MSHLYRVLNMTKQSFFQKLKRSQREQQLGEQVLVRVDQIRRDHPRMGVRCLYPRVKPRGMGRDKFERFCFKHGYRVKRQPNFRVTTDSRGVTRFPNLITQGEFTGVHQALVSDITYYEMPGRFCYITLIMDLFNREIVGYCAGQSLRTRDTTLAALKLARKNLGRDALKGAILHSDGGGQYYAKEFIKLTKDLQMNNSMTQETVYENAHSERLNGTIKNSYLYCYGPQTFEQLQKQLKRAVHMYNCEKPHMALNQMTPVEYRKAHSVDLENNSSPVQSYFPKSTEYHHSHLNDGIQKRRKIMSNSVNVI